MSRGEQQTLGFVLDAADGPSRVPVKPLVPYAFRTTGVVDTSRVVLPKDAVRGFEYVCPECGRSLVVRRGDRRRWHFAHKRQPDGCAFFGQDWPERLATHLVRASIEAAVTGGGAARCDVRRACGCREILDFGAGFTGARVERPGETPAPHVTVLDANGSPALGVVIRHRDPVDASTRGGLPIIELAATDVIDDRTPWPALSAWPREVCGVCRESRLSG